MVKTSKQIISQHKSEVVNNEYKVDFKLFKYHNLE